MIILPDTTTVAFDVDETLVLWNPVGSEPPEGSFLLGDISVRPHKVHIERLKLHKRQGHIVIVWSQGGSEWARDVVKLLQLEEFVDHCLTKPTWYYDDLDANRFMQRIYIKP